MPNFQTLNLEQIYTILKSTMEYTKLFVLLTKKHGKHVSWKLYIWRERNRNLENTSFLCNFSLVPSNFLLLVMPYTLFHAFYGFGGFFMCLHFQKFIKYLQFGNTLLHIAIIMFSAFLYIPFANKSYHCDWFLTLTEHQVQIVIKLTKKIPRSRSKWKLSHWCMPLRL